MDWQSGRQDDEEKKPKTKKEIMALSTAQYKNVMIYETPRGFGIFLGMWYFTFAALKNVTDLIDEWFDLNKN